MVIGLLVINTVIAATLLVFVLKKRRIDDESFAAILRLQEAIQSQLIATQASIEMRYFQLLATQQQRDVHLDPQASQWVLKKDSIEKIFEPGRITCVTDGNSDTVIDYKYTDSGEIECITRVGGNVRSTTVFSAYGAPLRGMLHGDDGEPTKVFTYDRLGQVEVATGVE